MDNLILTATNYTPAIHFDHSTGILEVAGTATPEDSYRFFQPLMDWIEAYKEQPAKKTILIFKMEYFNTSSTAFILRMIKAIGQLNDEGKDISIQWIYQKEDDDLIEAGRDFGILAETDIEFVQMG